jgi:hypothetical protein
MKKNSVLSRTRNSKITKAIKEDIPEAISDTSSMKKMKAK